MAGTCLEIDEGFFRFCQENDLAVTLLNHTYQVVGYGIIFAVETAWRFRKVRSERRQWGRLSFKRKNDENHG